MNDIFKNRFTIILSIVVVIVLGVIVFLVLNKSAPENGETEMLTDEVILYFSTRDAMYLVGEKREVAVEEIYFNTVAGLIEGPRASDLSPTIPEEVKLLGIEIKDGTASINFNQALIENHWGGSSGESLTVYSVVNTLTQFPDIDRVQFLIEGEKVETLAGHIYLTEPIDRNEDIIKNNDD